jgi:hypothetical protein
MGSAILRRTSGGSIVGPGENRYFFSIKLSSLIRAYQYYFIFSAVSSSLDFLEIIV